MDSGSLIPANNPNVREIQLTPGFDLGRPSAPSLYPQLSSSHESPLNEYFHVLRKRKWEILGCVVTIFTLVAIASLRTAKVYEASGKIAINKPDNSLNLQNSATFNLDYYDPSELETQVKILQSDDLALEVIHGLNLDRRPEFGGQASPSPSIDLEPDPLQDPAKASALLGGFTGNLRVAVSPNSRIIEIHYRSADPDLAANVVHTLMQTYIDDDRKKRYNSTMDASKWLEGQLVDMQMNVESSQEKLVRYQKEHEILGIDEKQNLTTEKLEELNKALTSAQSERMDKESFYNLVQSGNPDAIATGATALDSAGAQSAGAQSDSGLLEGLLVKQADLKIQAAELNTQFGPAYPKLAQLNSQLKEIDNQIQAEMKKIVNKVRGQYMTALGRETLLREALDKQKQEANKLNESAIEFNMLKRDADTYRALYEGILEKLKEAGVSAGLRSNNFQIVDDARPPSYPIEPNIPRNLGFAFVLGLASGVGLAFLREGMDNSIRTTEQAHVISGLPSLGMIPLGSKSAREGPDPKRLVIASSKEAVELVTQVRPQSQMAESYRALRTSLLLSNTGAPPKVIMVTSALPQEGKTTTSINCAVVLAQMMVQKGGRVLLIDADLRRPSIHKTLGMGPRSGLSNVLTGTVKLEKAIAPTSILPNLFVLPAGTPPPDPAELLASTEMRDLLTELREQYDHIVVDTPPSLSVTDAVVLSPRADAVVLVIRAEHTTKQSLRRARELLGQVNAKVIGVLLNAVDLSSPDYYYYYEYQGKYAQYYQNARASEDDEDEENLEDTATPSSSSA
jgi:capsular exopolysaccharide synthesis family protein